MVPSSVLNSRSAHPIVRKSGSDLKRRQQDEQDPSIITALPGRLVMATAAQRHLTNIVLAATAAGALLAGCSSTPTTHSPATPGTVSAEPSAPSSAPPSTSPVEEAKQQALTAYRGMWDAFSEAATTSDWRSPALGRYATGVALTNLSRGLYADHYNGLVTKGTPTHSAEAASFEPQENPTTVVVTDCSASTKALKYHADTGALADETGGGRRLINGVVERQADGSWKVSDFGVHEVGSC
jgi:hypothetical protein